MSSTCWRVHGWCSRAHRDAVANAGRSALLVAALTQLSAEPGTLLAATRDWLRQDYRAGAMPETAALHRQAPGGRHPGRRVRGRAVGAGPAGWTGEA